MGDQDDHEEPRRSNDAGDVLTFRDLLNGLALLALCVVIGGVGGWAYGKFVGVP